MHISIPEDALEVDSYSLGSLLEQVHHSRLALQVAIVEVFGFSRRWLLLLGLPHPGLAAPLSGLVPPNPLIQLLDLLHLLHDLELEDLDDIAIVIDGLGLTDGLLVHSNK